MKKHTVATPLILCVHGTFVTSASFAPSDSVLMKSIKDRIGDGFVVQEFRWSGNNSHSARQRAAADLIQLLHNLAKDKRHSKIVIIAHSHGGNVAMLALCKTSQLKKVHGLICIATPFFQVVPRNLEPAITVFGVIIWLGILIAGFVFVESLLPKQWDWDMTFIVSLTSGYGLASLFGGLAMSLNNSLPKLAEQYASTFQLDRCSTPVYSVTVKLDETAVILTGASWLFNLGYRCLNRLLTMKAFKIWFGVCVAYVLATESMSGPFGVIYALWVCVGSYLMIALVLGLFAMLQGLPQGTKVTFGWDHAFWSLITKVRVSSRPDVSGEFTSDEFKIDAALPKIRHSEIYSYRESVDAVVKKVEQWLRN